jgi:hypothetical protein
LFGSLTEEALDGECQGFFRLYMERRDDGRVTITTGPNYHMVRINQSNIKRSPGEAAAKPELLGAQWV